MATRGVSSVFNENEKKIEITYDEVIDDGKEIDADNKNNNLKYSELQFVYNGEAFIGDYEKLKEIEDLYWIKQ